MALTDATLQSLGNSLATLAPYLSLHTADPTTVGDNESAAARQSVTWSVDADGDLSLSSAVAFTGGAASGAVTHVGLWSASTAGTFRGAFALTGDTNFNAAGEYTVTSLSINTTSG